MIHLLFPLPVVEVWVIVQVERSDLGGFGIVVTDFTEATTVVALHIVAIVIIATDFDHSSLSLNDLLLK